MDLYRTNQCMLCESHDEVAGSPQPDPGRSDFVSPGCATRSVSRTFTRGVLWRAASTFQQGV